MGHIVIGADLWSSIQSFFFQTSELQIANINSLIMHRLAKSLEIMNNHKLAWNSLFDFWMTKLNPSLLALTQLPPPFLSAALKRYNKDLLSPGGRKRRRRVPDLTHQGLLTQRR